MTSSSSYQTYDFTALSGAVVRSAKKGASFTMPSEADISFSVRDDDNQFQADNHNNEHSDDRTGQTATGEWNGKAIGNGGQIYMETVVLLRGSDGHTYKMAKVEQEGSSIFAYTFVDGVAPAGVTLTVTGYRNWNDVEYDRLGAGDREATDPKAPDFVECNDPNAVVIDFEGLAAGTTVSDQYAGVTIKGVREENTKATANSAMIFDGANPTGGDTDLTATGDNVLIISEDGDASDPDDNFGGGRLWIMFDEPASVHDLKVLDAEEGGRIGLVTTDQGTVWVNIPGGTDGGIQQILIDVDNVVKLDVILNGSGAIDDICYVPGQPAPLGSIAGTYFMDNNDNDVQDAADMGLEGQTVWLVEVGVGVVAQTTTDANGDYIFEGLDAGDYYVRFDGNNVGDKVLVNSNAGNDDTVDSDIKFTGSSGNHNTATISLAQGENVTDVDAGVEDPAPVVGSLSGRFFMDTDGNDRDNDNGNEPAVAGVLVMLLDANGNPTGDQVFTDANGEYSFTDLAPGTYGVKFTDPNGVLDGKVLVDPNWNNNSLDDRDSDAIGDTTESIISNITVTSGNNTPDNDAGVEDANDAPVAGDDAGKGCFDSEICVDVLSNDTDADGNTLTVTQIEGQAIGTAANPTDLGNGVVAYLNANGEVCFDASGSTDFRDNLDVGEEATVTYQYTISDGAGGTATADVDVTFCGARDTMQEICDSVDGLTVSVDLGGNLDDYLEITVTSGDARLLGTFEELYCVDKTAPLAPGVLATFDATVSILDPACIDVSAFASSAIAQNALDHLGEINWIINNRDGVLSQYTDAEIQGAIWEYTNNDSFVNGFNLGADGVNDADEIVALADQNADYVVPQDGLVAVLFNPIEATSNPAGMTQPLIAGIDLWEDCIC